MKKNFVRVMLFGALTLAVSTTVTSCKDYDDDIKGLQEQVDNIKSTNPVSTEDMKAAVEKAQEELQEKLDLLTSQLNDKAATSKLEEEIEKLKQALEDAVGEDASNLAGKLVEAQNDLNILKQAMADEGLVGKLKKDVDDLKAMQTTLSALISAEKQYIASGDVSGFKNTSFDKFINQSIIAALNDEGESKGEIANYVITAVQNGVASNGKALNDHIVAYGIEGVTGLTDFVDKIYNEIFKEDGAIKKQLDGLDELLNAINAYVGSGQGQLADYQAVIDGIMATRDAVTALSLPEGKTLSQAVQDIITAELADSKATLGKLQSDLKAEISALKGMIQSIVYVPESADRTVTLNNFMVNFTEWKPLATSDKMVVKFRVSPRTAIAELTKEDSKYLVATDKQKLTRSAIVPFEVESIAAVEGEGNENLIAVTLKGLSAADNKKGYAISLTVKDKDEATRLNDISSDYFAVVQNTLYIQNVEWSSVNADQTELNNVADATIDYKAEGSKLVITTSTNEGGDQGVKEDQTPEELYLDASLFDLSFEMSDNYVDAAENFVLTTDKDRAILSVKDPKPERLGHQCKVISKVTIKDPASTSTTPATAVFEKDYEEITIKSKDEYTAEDIAQVWHSSDKPYELADIADIKTKLGLETSDDFTGYSIVMTTPVNNEEVDLVIDDIDNTTIQLIAKGGKVYDGKVVATLSSANTSLVITIPSVKIDYPKEEEYTLVNNTPGTWDGATALLNPNFVTTSEGIASVTATRSLTELFSNFTDIKEYIDILGGDVNFALKNSPIQGVDVDASTGVITVNNTYEGQSIVALVTIKCGEKKLFEKNIPIAIPAEMNGTFAYATVAEGVTQGELAVTVTNPATRKTPVVLKDALSWKDAKENVIWPLATSDIYDGDPMTLNGFSVSYALKNNADNTKFELNSAAGTLTMKDDVASWTQYSIPMEIVVTATPKSPWGDMSSLAKDITVKVPAWRDIQ